MSSQLIQDILTSLSAGGSEGTVVPNKKPIEMDIITPGICDLRMAQMSAIYSKMGIVTATSSKEGGKK